MKTIEINPSVESLSRDILELAKDHATVSTAYSQATIDYLNARQEIYTNKKPGFLSRKNISFTIFGSIFTLVSASLFAPSIKDWFPGKSEPTISDTEKENGGNWPEGYKPSALQLELQKMLPEFPPKEITDSKLTEEEREEKYEEAIFQVFKDSKVPATEEMTERLIVEINKLIEITKTKTDTFGRTQKDEYLLLKRDFGLLGLQIEFTKYDTPNNKNTQVQIERKINHLRLGANFFSQTEIPHINLVRRKLNASGSYEDYPHSRGYLISMAGSKNGYASFSGDSLYLDKLLGEDRKEMHQNPGMTNHSLFSESGKHTKLKRKILNTSLALILLSNDTFDLEFDERNIRENTKRVDKILSLIEYFRARATKGVPETRAENKFTKTTPKGTVLFYGRQGTTSDKYDLDSINFKDENGEYFVNHEVGKEGKDDGSLLFVASDKKGSQYSFEFNSNGKLTQLSVREDFAHLLPNLGIDKEKGSLNVGGVYKYFLFYNISENEKVQNMFRSEIDTFIDKLNVSRR